MSHSIPIRIYYEDTDAGGVVYHGSYLNFAERGRTEFLRSIGHTNSELAKSLGMIFVVRHLDIEYFKPAFLDDLLQLTTATTEIKNTSFTMTHRFQRDDEILTQMSVSLVCVDSKTYRPVRVPDILRSELSKG